MMEQMIQVNLSLQKSIQESQIATRQISNNMSELRSDIELQRGQMQSQNQVIRQIQGTQDLLCQFTPLQVQSTPTALQPQQLQAQPSPEQLFQTPTSHNVSTGPTNPWQIQPQPQIWPNTASPIRPPTSNQHPLIDYQLPQLRPKTPAAFPQKTREERELEALQKRTEKNKKTNPEHQATPKRNEKIGTKPKKINPTFYNSEGMRTLVDKVYSVKGQKSLCLLPG